MHFTAGLFNVLGFIVALPSALVLIWTQDVTAARIMLTGLTIYAASFPLAKFGHARGN